MLKRASKHLKGNIYLIKKEISRIGKIEHSNFEVNFYGHQIKFKKPKLTSQENIILNKTYAIKTYIPLKINYKQKEVFP